MCPYRLVARAWRRLVPGIALTVLLTTSLHAQQAPDTLFTHLPVDPGWSAGKGPVVAIDRGHHNYHTRDGGFQPFAMLAERDGFVVRDHDGLFTDSSLAEVDVLVIANALGEDNVGRWVAPADPAFTTEEIATVRAYVEAGGSLLLIADHMPFGGAAEDMARTFGALFTNGFTTPPGGGRMQQDVFIRDGGGPVDGRLNASHPLLDRAPSLRIEPDDAGNETGAIIVDGAVDSVRAFTGQGFLISGALETVLAFPADTEVLLPDTAWVFDASTPRFSDEAWVQGATREFGAGRVALFGEAAMFTAQRVGPESWRVGFTHPRAHHNARFVLAVLRWLALDE